MEQIVQHDDDTALLNEIPEKTKYVRENFSEAQAMKVLALDMENI